MLQPSFARPRHSLNLLRLSAATRPRFDTSSYWTICSFMETVEAGPLNSRDVHKNILAAATRADDHMHLRRQWAGVSAAIMQFNLPISVTKESFFCRATSTSQFGSRNIGRPGRARAKEPAKASQQPSNACDVSPWGPALTRVTAGRCSCVCIEEDPHGVDRGQRTAPGGAKAR
jgi:hypothetical protein